MTLSDLKAKQDTPAVAQGVYDNIQAEDYHRIMGLTKSGLMMLRKSPAHFWDWMNSPSIPSTKAMNIGTACHTLVFEPHKWDDEITVVPDNAPKRPTEIQRNAKKPSEETLAAIKFWDEFNAKSKGRATISAEDEYVVRKMAEQVFNNEEAMALLKHPSAKAEVSIVSKEKVKGLDIVCKGRCDLITMDNTVIVDLKTCEDASPEAFSKNFMSMGYWMQAAHYISIARNSGMPIQKFIFIAAEKNPPYCTALYTLDDSSLEKAFAIRNKLVERLSDCIARNDFPAYQRGVQALTMPGWIQ